MDLLLVWLMPLVGELFFGRGDLERTEVATMDLLLVLLIVSTCKLFFVFDVMMDRLLV